MSFAALGIILAIFFILIATLAMVFLQRSEQPRSHAIWYSGDAGSGRFSSIDASCSPGSDGGSCDGGGGGD